jgi:hypothetical protein
MNSNPANLVYFCTTNNKVSFFKKRIVRDLSAMAIPAIRFNLFLIALGLHPKQLKKRFPLLSGLKSEPFYYLFTK